MSIRFRYYGSPVDFIRMGDFLIENFKPKNEDGNWLQPAWEYMHSHPFLDRSSLDRIGIWEDKEQVVGIVHFESRLGEAFFQIHPDYGNLKPEMLSFAEDHLVGTSSDGKRSLRVYVNDFDQEFGTLAASHGYRIEPQADRPIAQFIISVPFPQITLPEGFRLTDLAQDCDWKKIDRVLWRGFNHPGEPPVDAVQERKKMQETPNFRYDLKIVVEAPNRDFVSFSGLWYEPTNRYAYVEPVATDPDYRRRGLGKAAVLEGIRRCGELGAATAYVGSDQEFYLAMGFQKVFTSECWIKQF